MVTIDMKEAGFAYDKDTVILKDLNLTIHEGEAVGLIGANGAGKSTFLKILTGLLMPSGHVQICGMDVTKAHLSEIRKRIGFVFQDSESQLFMPTVYDDLAFGPRNYGMSREEVERRVDSALNRMDISYLKHRQNYRMSGGEKRLASIAAILAMEPDIILMDEPSITLDPKNRRNLIRLLNDMPETKLIASHDLDMIMETCDRVLLIGEQTLLADGNCREILTDQSLLERCHLELPYCLQEPVWKPTGNHI